MLLLDTLPLVDFFKEESKAIKNIIIDSENDGKKLCISSVTLSELFYILADFKGTEFAKVCIDSIKIQLDVISVDAEIAETAGDFKFRYSGKDRKGLPMADAVIAATSYKTGATLVTSDPHFKKIEEISIHWIQ